MSHLASVLYYQGLFDQAEQMQRQHLDVSKRVKGLTHPNTLQSLHDLGMMLLGRDQPDEAKAALQECFDARISTLGRSHPHTLETMTNLVGLLGASDVAHSLLTEAVEGLTESVGEGHPSTRVAIRYLGRCYLNRGEPGLAEQHFRRALELDSAVVGEVEGVLIDMNLLASLHRAAGRLGEAEQLLTEAIGECERRLGGNSNIMIQLVADLGKVLQEMKDEGGGPGGNVKA
jgi:tetratricopeptide (TPR) repeat protein